MAMSCASLPTSLFSSPRKRSSVSTRSWLRSSSLIYPQISTLRTKRTLRFLSRRTSKPRVALPGKRKKLAPAFSNWSIKALEPVAHEHMDYFVAKMKKSGAELIGVGLMEWTNWLAMDQAAEMAWNEKLHQMRGCRLSQVSLAWLSRAANASQGKSRYISMFSSASTCLPPSYLLLFHPLQYLAVPVAKLKALSTMEAAVQRQYRACWPFRLRRACRPSCSLRPAWARSYRCTRAADDVRQLWPYVQLVLWYTPVSTWRA